MEHTEAIETNASDRYVLRQLSAAEADAFEEHYFDCADCAEDVRLGMTIMEGGRRLVREAGEPVETPMAPVVPIDSRPRWSKWIPAAAVAAMMAIPINIALLMRMQNAVARGPLFAVAAQHDPSVVRGPGTAAPATAGEITIQEGDTAIVWIAVMTGPSYSRYELQVMRGTSVLGKQPLTPEQVEDPIPFVPLGMGAGTYHLVIHGSDPEGQTAKVFTQKLTIVKR
jgi:hypothetical protein